MNKEKVSKLAERLALALKMRKMKQADLERKSGVPKCSICLYLKDKYNPKQDRVSSMALALNVSDEWLMGYDVPMERKEQKNTPDERMLTESERKLLLLFRTVDEKNQNMLIRILEAAVDKKQ